jgi:hypothetical protein
MSTDSYGQGPRDDGHVHRGPHSADGRKRRYQDTIDLASRDRGRVCDVRGVAGGTPTAAVSEHSVDVGPDQGASPTGAEGAWDGREKLDVTEGEARGLSASRGGPFGADPHGPDYELGDPDDVGDSGWGMAEVDAAAAISQHAERPAQAVEAAGGPAWRGPVHMGEGVPGLRCCVRVAVEAAAAETRDVPPPAPAAGFAARPAAELGRPWLPGAQASAAGAQPAAAPRAGPRDMGPQQQQPKKARDVHVAEIAAPGAQRQAVRPAQSTAGGALAGLRPGIQGAASAAPAAAAVPALPAARAHHPAELLRGIREPLGTAAARVPGGGGGPAGGGALPQPRDGVRAGEEAPAGAPPQAPAAPMRPLPELLQCLGGVHRRPAAREDIRRHMGPPQPTQPPELRLLCVTRPAPGFVPGPGPLGGVRDVSQATRAEVAVLWAAAEQHRLPTWEPSLLTLRGLGGLVQGLMVSCLPLESECCMRCSHQRCPSTAAKALAPDRCVQDFAKHMARALEDAIRNGQAGLERFAEEWEKWRLDSWQGQLVYTWGEVCVYLGNFFAVSANTKRTPPGG